MTIIEQMRAVAPPGQLRLDAATTGQLRELTIQLIAQRQDEAAAEQARYLAVAKRELCLPTGRLRDRLEGAVILVTGGTGCIGSMLISQLQDYKPARVVSASRGVTTGWPRHNGAEYRTADIRSPNEIFQLAREVKPDIIFHVAGQRDPGLAEIEVQRTVATNVYGTYNVLFAAQAARVGKLVHASTGKCVRLFSGEVYAASKKAAEWLCADAAETVPVSAVRFTHVVDNALMYRQLHSQDVIRLHSPDIMFYVQSATEAAQLLLLASLDTSPGHLPIRAITDLSMPVSLLDLALGALAERGGGVLYLSGYDQGYVEDNFPIYDPASAGDVSPLLNAVEASAIVPSGCPMTDVFLARGSLRPERPLDGLYRATFGGGAGTSDRVPRGAQGAVLDPPGRHPGDRAGAGAGPDGTTRRKGLAQSRQPLYPGSHQRGAGNPEAVMCCYTHPTRDALAQQRGEVLDLVLLTDPQRCQCTYSGPCVRRMSLDNETLQCDWCWPLGADGHYKACEDIMQTSLWPGRRFICGSRTCWKHGCGIAGATGRCPARIRSARTRLNSGSPTARQAERPWSK